MNTCQLLSTTLETNSYATIGHWYNQAVCLCSGDIKPFNYHPSLKLQSFVHFRQYHPSMSLTLCTPCSTAHAVWWLNIENHIVLVQFWRHNSERICPNKTAEQSLGY